MGIQVTELTQNKTCYEKEFIDFEFNGKHISEFGMVAVADGGRHSFDAAPSFEDETSSVNGVDGQYYWGTHFNSLKRTYYLATDGMTEAQVNAFKLHFKPGQYGKFIEDKLAHRYGYARVAAVTTFSTVPFRKQQTITIGGVSHTIYINEYKGDCRITFEWDDPYMYATENYVNITEETTNDELQGLLRAVYANGEPSGSSWNKSPKCFVGDSTYVLKDGKLLSNINYSGNKGMLYYNPSTATTNCKISLTLTPTFTDAWPVYYGEIEDDINITNMEGGLGYNSIASTEIIDPIDDNDNFSYPASSDLYTNHFYYTTPDTIYSINRAIQIANNFYVKNSGTGVALDLEEVLRLEIVNTKVMGWAASVLRILQMRDALYDTESGNFLTGTITVDCSMLKNNLTSSESLNWCQYFNVYMLLLLAECEDLTKYHLDNEDGIAGTWTFNPYTIVFDGINSQTTMKFSYNQIIYVDSLTKFPDTEESCGDMIQSGYLKLDGGDKLDDNGMIEACHHLQFFKGKETLNVTKMATLEYQYTYL